MKKTIIAITGRTAAGKSVVAKKMAERLGLKVLQSYTTRQPRPDELADMEHSDHIFISNEEYNKLQDIRKFAVFCGLGWPKKQRFSYAKIFLAMPRKFK